MQCLKAGLENCIQEATLEGKELSEKLRKTDSKIGDLEGAQECVEGLSEKFVLLEAEHKRRGLQKQLEKLHKEGVSKEWRLKLGCGGT